MQKWVDKVQKPQFLALYDYLKAPNILKLLKISLV